MLLSAGAALIAINWLVFIYAVISKQVLQASLGYFINPLLSIFLGMIFLRERLRRWQRLAVIIAGVAVLNLALRSTTLPWIAVSLAVSFGLYGLVRKKVDIDSLHALLVETIILLPPALVVVALPIGYTFSTGTLGILSLSGIVTAVPLLFFGAALRRLKLSTMGFLQYAGPTLQFLVAVVVFRERLDRPKLVSFAMCWLAIAVYAADSALARQPQQVALPIGRADGSDDSQDEGSDHQPDEQWDSDDYEDERNTADAVNENGNMEIKSLPCIGSNIFGFLAHRQVNDQRQNKSNSQQSGEMAQDAPDFVVSIRSGHSISLSHSFHNISLRDTNMRLNRALRPV
jgi:chloramphenicol-sensitive protein RarD